VPAEHGSSSPKREKEHVQREERPRLIEKINRKEKKVEKIKNF